MTHTSKVTFTKDVPTGDFWQGCSEYTAIVDDEIVGRWKNNRGAGFGRIGNGYNEPMKLNEWKAAIRAAFAS